MSIVMAEGIVGGGEREKRLLVKIPTNTNEGVEEVWWLFEVADACGCASYRQNQAHWHVGQ